MSKRVTATDLDELAPGARLNDGARAFFKKNSDGTVSAFQRSPAGIDVRAGRTEKGRGITAADVKALREACELLRNDAQRIANAIRLGKRKAGAAPKDDDPSVSPKQIDLTRASTVGDVWRTYAFECDRDGRWTDGNARRNRQRIARTLRVSPMWDRPASMISSDDVKALLAPRRKSTPAEAMKLASLLGLVFEYGKDKAGVVVNPVHAARKSTGLTGRKVLQDRFAAYTEVEELRKLRADIGTMPSDGPVRHAMMLQAYTCQRTGEVIPAEWSEFKPHGDDGSMLWTIPRARMKVKVGPDQKLILPPLVAKYVRAIPRTSRFVFPNADGSSHIALNLDKPMRETLERRGEHVPHGWRSALETLSDDGDVVGADGRPLFSQRWIDAVLDHGPKDETKKHYRRKPAYPGAGRVLAWWAQLLGNPFGDDEAKPAKRTQQRVAAEV
jgi:integrase